MRDREERGMLRALRVAAPVVAAAMVVVLLVEPRCHVRPTGCPTLRVFLAGAGRGLDRNMVQAAVAWGEEGEPGSYVLRRVPSAGEPVGASEPAGVVYTPFLRIAWAAHARQSSGRQLSVDAVPAWMAAPVPLRGAASAAGGAGWRPRHTCGRRGADRHGDLLLEPQPTLTRPLWVTDDPAVTARFGATVPFSDLGVIAAYPIEAFRSDLDFVAFHRVDGPDGPSSVEMRGRLDPSDLEGWR